MKIVFMGTPDFAVPCLDALLKNNHEVLLAVTQPDKPKGRSQVLTPPPVKDFANVNGIPVFQPNSLKTDESYEKLLVVNADVFIVVAYGKILPQRILDIPKYGCINIHASLLPKYRGAAPIQWSIAGGETVTGVTSMQMDAGLDTGDMLISEELPVLDDETGETLHDKLCLLGANVLIKTLDALKKGELTPVKQNDSLSNYAPMITKENTKIDFSKSANEVRNLIRAMNPFPGAYAFYKGKKMKILSAEISEICSNGKTGEVCHSDSDSFYVNCSDLAVKITELQLEGKKRMLTSDFLKGNKVIIGDLFS